jgi:PncC family amidohydrolase
MNIIEELFQKLGNSKLSAAESVTGGAFASAITSVAGASKHFKGSVVTYTNDIKQSILGVNTSNGVVNNFTAEAMAKSVKDKFGTNVSISFTGNAGPTAMDDVPVGVVFVGICIGDKS